MIRNNDITDIDLNITFSVNYEYMNEIITVDLKENGRYLVVDELSKNEFIKYLLNYF